MSAFDPLRSFVDALGFDDAHLVPHLRNICAILLLTH